MVKTKTIRRKRTTKPKPIVIKNAACPRCDGPIVLIGDVIQCRKKCGLRIG